MKRLLTVTMGVIVLSAGCVMAAGISGVGKTKEVPKPDNWRTNVTNDVARMAAQIAQLQARVEALSSVTARIDSLSGQIQQQSNQIAEVKLDAQRGWGAKAWVYDPAYLLPSSTNWDGFVAWAEMPSYNGSFFEYSDEAALQRYTVSVYVEEDVIGHLIPIDAGGGARLYVDEVLIGGWINQHGAATVNLTKGMHQIDFIVYSGPGANWSNWTAFGVGPCLWGTDERIRWVATGEVEEE